MSKRIKVADLPEFDAAHYLDSETSIAAYLTDILEANDASLLASALGGYCPRSWHDRDRQDSGDHAGSPVQSSASRQRSTIRYCKPGVCRTRSASRGPACSSHARDGLNGLCAGTSANHALDGLDHDDPSRACNRNTCTTAMECPTDHFTACLYLCSPHQHRHCFANNFHRVVVAGFLGRRCESRISPSLFHKLRAPAVGRGNSNRNGKNNRNRKGSLAWPSFTW